MLYKLGETFTENSLKISKCASKDHVVHLFAVELETAIADTNL